MVKCLQKSFESFLHYLDLTLGTTWARANTGSYCRVKTNRNPWVLESGLKTAASCYTKVRNLTSACCSCAVFAWSEMWSHCFPWHMLWIFALLSKWITVYWCWWTTKLSLTPPYFFLRGESQFNRQIKYVKQIIANFKVVSCTSLIGILMPLQPLWKYVSGNEM